MAQRSGRELIQLDHPYCSGFYQGSLEDKMVQYDSSTPDSTYTSSGGYGYQTNNISSSAALQAASEITGKPSIKEVVDPDGYLSLHVAEEEAVVTAGDSETDDDFSGDEELLGPMQRMEYPVPSPDTTCDEEDDTTPSSKPSKKEVLKSNLDPDELRSLQLGQTLVTSGDSETDDAFSGDEELLGPMERMEFPMPSPDTTYDEDGGTIPSKLSETELAEYTTLKKELQRLKKEVEELKMHDVWGLGKLSTFTDDAFEMYTGFSCYREFMAFWQVIEPSVNKMVRVSRGSRSQEEKTSDRYMRESLPPIEEFTMYLMFISMGAEDLYLAHLFSIPPSTVLCIISLWTNFLYTLLGSGAIWLDVEQVRARLPADYKEDFGDVQVIVDTVEVNFALDPPEEPSKCPMFWSFAHQKYERKMKALIGVAPHGPVTFVSPLCDGSVSDEVLFRRSGLLDLLDKDSAIMLPDEDMTVPECVKCKVYRPPPPTMPFCKPSDQTKKMIRFWNNAIGVLLRIRDREIFMRTMPSFVAGSYDEVFTVSLLLSNYQNAPLVGPYTRRARD
ncbi:uncharacterized protein LOC134462129 [Engraulis encrasicolus]|uniref:uncharacterized protein LOC134462129 n=1 Tax=Engraulis encrasicolus TaxID=184585 RepID=UPI002FD69590